VSEILIGVSAYLVGEQARHDGGHKRHAFLLDELAPYDQADARTSSTGSSGMPGCATSSPALVRPEPGPFSRPRARP
jgi:hypothetical protein